LFAAINASLGTNTGSDNTRIRSWWRRLLRMPTPTDVPQAAFMLEDLDLEDFGSDMTFTSICQLPSSSFGWSLSQVGNPCPQMPPLLPFMGSACV
jgi:hypothetical protein